MKVESVLAQAVRNSLNLPELKLDVRRVKNRKAWRFRLHKGSFASSWIELNDEMSRIMRDLKLLPALYLGTFRVAYQELRELTELNKDTKARGG
jgi:hypothetical protein